MGEKIVWNFELNVIKDYLSRFYRSKSACIREYVANAVAAQYRAGVAEPVYVEITPEKITVEDKGIGISREKFGEVFMWFGRSENRYVEDVQGKFGLGAKSFMMLTGEKGRVVMKTKSRETGESYTAVLTATGAEVVEDGGKEGYGTRFEIYPEEKLTPEEVGKFYDCVAERFDFSRIPVHVKAYADEPFEISKITGRELKVEKVKSQSWGEIVKYVEAVCGIQNHDVELIEENEFYEIYRLKTKPYHERWSSERTAVVIGDVLVEGDFPERDILVRIKAENGEEVEVAGVKVKLPEPLPNRDGYRNLSKFEKLLALKLRLDSFKSTYEYYMKLPPRDLASLGTSLLESLQEKVRSIAAPYGEADQELLMAIEKNLPGFNEFRRTLAVLLTEVLVYGSWGYVKRNGRRGTVTVAEVLNAHYDGRNVKYVRKRPSKRKEIVMEEEGIYAVYTEDPDLIEFLEENGIEEARVRDKTARVKVYRALGKFEGCDAEYVGLDRLIYDWSGEMFIYAEKVSDIKGKILPPCRVVVGSRKLYKKLKEIFGDFVMTYDGWYEMVLKTTLVTDGYEVATLKDLECAAAVFVETEHTQLLPVLRTATGDEVYAFVDATDCSHAKSILGAKELKKWFEKWCKDYSAWSIRDMAENVDRRAAEMLHLLLMHGIEYVSIRDDLIETVYRYAGIRRGRTMGELKELARPIVEKIVEEYGTLKLGKFPVDAFVYKTHMGTEDEGLTAEGVKLANPLIQSHTYDLAGKTGEEVRKLKVLQQRFGLFGALIYHAEAGGTLDGKSAREVVEKYLPPFARSKDDWELLVKTAPKVSKKLALAVLL